MVRQIIKSKRGAYMRNQWDTMKGFDLLMELLDKMENLWHPDYKHIAEVPFEGEPLPVLEALFELLLSILHKQAANQHIFWSKYPPIEVVAKFSKSYILNTEDGVRVFDILFSMATGCESIIPTTHRILQCRDGRLCDTKAIWVALKLLPLVKSVEVQKICLNMLFELAGRSSERPESAAAVRRFQNQEALCRGRIVEVLNRTISHEPDLAGTCRLILHQLMKHRVEPVELHEFLKEIRFPEESRFQRLAETIVFHNQNAFVEFDYSTGDVAMLAVKTARFPWNIDEGFSMSVWINIQAFSEGDDVALKIPDQLIRHKDRLIRLFSCRSTEKGVELFTVYISSQMGLLVCWGQTPKVFPAIKFETDVWYQVTFLFKQISGTRNTVAEKLRFQRAQENCELSVHINGGLIRSTKIPSDLPLTLKNKDFNIVYGDDVIPKEKRNCVWWMGGTRLYRGVMTLDQVKADYVCGAEYIGEFHPLTRPTLYYKGEQCVRSMREVKEDFFLQLVYAFHPEVRVSIGEVLDSFHANEIPQSSKLALLEAASTGTYEVLLNICRSYENKDNLGSFPVACLRGSASSIHPLPLTKSLLTCGGIDNIIEFVRRAVDSESLEASLALLAVFLVKEKENLLDMVNCHGYAVLAALLKRKAHYITEAACDVLFSIVEGRLPPGVTKFIKGMDEKTLKRIEHRWFDVMYYKHCGTDNWQKNIGVKNHRFAAPCCKRMYHNFDSSKEESSRVLLANSLAFKRIMLNFSIWDKVSEELQNYVFNRFYFWATSGPNVGHMALLGEKVEQMRKMHKWNVRRLSDIQAVTSCLDILTEQNLSLATRSNVLEIISIICDQELDEELVSLLLGYVVKSAKALEECEIEKQLVEKANENRQRRKLETSVSPESIRVQSETVARLLQILHKSMRLHILNNNSDLSVPLKSKNGGRDTSGSMLISLTSPRMRIQSYSSNENLLQFPEKSIAEILEDYLDISTFQLLCNPLLPPAINRAALCFLHSLLIIAPNYFDMFVQGCGFQFLVEIVPEMKLHPRLPVLIFGLMFNTETDFLFPNTLVEPFAVGNLMEAVPIQTKAVYVRQTLPLLMQFLRRQVRACMMETVTRTTDGEEETTILVHEDGKLVVEVMKYIVKVARVCPEFQNQVIFDEPYLEQLLEILFDVSYGIEDEMWKDSEFEMEGKSTLDMIICAFLNRVLKQQYESDETRALTVKVYKRISRSYPDIFRDGETTMEDNFRIYLAYKLTNNIKDILSFPMLLENLTSANETTQLLKEIHHTFVRFCGRTGCCLRFPGPEDKPTKVHMNSILHPFILANDLCTILEQVVESVEIRINAPTDKTLVPIKDLEMASYQLREVVQNVLVGFLHVAWRKMKSKELTRLLKLVLKFNGCLFHKEHKRQVFFYGLMKILVDSLSHVANLAFSGVGGDNENINSYNLGKVCMQMWNLLIRNYQDLMAANLDRDVCLMIVKDKGEEFQTWLRRTGMDVFNSTVKNKVTAEFAVRWDDLEDAATEYDKKCQEERRLYLKKSQAFRDSLAPYQSKKAEVVLHEVEDERMAKSKSSRYYRKCLADEELTNMRRKLRQDSILWKDEQHDMWKNAQKLNFTEGPHRMRKKLERHYDFSQTYRVAAESELELLESAKANSKMELLQDKPEVPSSKLLTVDRTPSNHTTSPSMPSINEREQVLADIEIKMISPMFSERSLSFQDFNNRLSFDSRKISVYSFCDAKANFTPRNGSKLESAKLEGHVAQLLSPGDSLDHELVWNCSTITGMDSQQGIMVVCESNMYFIFDIGFNDDDCSFHRVTDNLQNTGFMTGIVKDKERGSLLQVRRPIEEDAESQTNKARKPLSWPIDQITQCYRRSFQLRKIAAEVFCDEGSNFILIFDETKHRDAFMSHLQDCQAGEGKPALKPTQLSDKIASNTMLQVDIASASKTGQFFNRVVGGGQEVAANITNKWKRGEMSNFAYLIFLNTLAGRSFNDITQYPVFPWIIRDFDSEELDLSSPYIFRDLSGPMGVQTLERAELFKERFEMWESPDGVTPAFHYGTHYSSAAIVLHYLIRVAPFTKTHLELQSGKFDQADRLFRSVPLAWRLASEEGGLQDVKELIPEFFYLPEMFDNQNQFDFGKLQESETEEFVNHVELPTWAYDDSVRFVYLHREALECQYVSDHLHEWIDLIFGYKQTGKEAEKATNVFHYLSYEAAEKLFDEIDDPVQKEAMLCSVQNFGQTPHQLFTRAHPMRTPSPVLNIYTHPQLLIPQDLSEASLTGAVTSMYLDAAQKLKSQSGHRITLPPVCKRAIEYGFPDHSLRIFRYDKCMQVFEDIHVGQISCVDLTWQENMLFTGGTDCVVMLWRLRVAKDTDARRMLKSSLRLHSKLYGHSGTITHVKHVPSYQTLVSASTDQTVIIWDLQKKRVHNRLSGFRTPITAISVEMVSGHIFVATKRWLTAWTINGLLLSRWYVEKGGDITCIQAAARSEWQTHKNMVLVSGHRDGSLKFWSLEIPTYAGVKYKKMINTQPKSSFRSERKRNRSKHPSNPFDTTLRFKQIHLQAGHKFPVTCIHISPFTDQKMWTGDAEGKVMEWAIQKGKKAGEQGHWVHDEECEKCPLCDSIFSLTVRRHHCRQCGHIFCGGCSNNKIALPLLGFVTPVRTCNTCFHKHMHDKRNSSATSFPEL